MCLHVTISVMWHDLYPIWQTISTTFIWQLCWYHEINKTCLTQNLKNDAGGQLLSLPIIVIQVIKDFIKTYRIGIFNL